MADRDNHHDFEQPHALIIPYPLQGHVIPAVGLAIKLASKGFTISFVNTDSIHHQISESQPDISDDIFSVARKSGLDIRYHTVSDGLPLEFDRSLYHDQYMASILHVFSAHIEELVRKVVRSGPRLHCLIADTFYVWPSMIASKFGLVNVSFWTEPALVFTLYYHMDLLRRNGHFGLQDNREDTITYIPGIAAIEPKDLMSYLQETDTSTIVHQIIFKAFQDVKKADYVVGNTVENLEPDIIAALQVKKPFYAVGPIFPGGRSSVATSLWPESDCSNWLDAKPHGSVLYVSFGSYAHVRKPDLIEIANGLLLSNVDFVWILRPDIVSSDETHPLPLGFMEDCKKGDRGRILPWCRQIQVLSHQAVGGFLTHCGWNSILESIWCGVPMLCFPLLTDQFTNRKLVTDDWKVGIDITDDNKTRLSRHKVAQQIQLVINGKLGDDIRHRMAQVKSTLKEAIQDDGSSAKNLDLFIQEIHNRCIRLE